MKTIITALVILFHFAVTTAQEVCYVSADSGLVVREAPSKNAERIGKFNYAAKLVVTKHSGINFSVNDRGVSIPGEWLEVINADESEKPIRGYVFGGFLTESQLTERLYFEFEDTKVNFEGFEIWEMQQSVNESEKNTIIVSVALGETPENKSFSIETEEGQKIEVYQRYQNSITVMNKGPHCNLTEWKNYHSPWQKVRYSSKEKVYVTKEYSEKDWQLFQKVSIEELKAAINDFCGEYWAALIKDIEGPNQYPSGVGMSSIQLKIIITKQNGEVTENFINFEIPMGC